jgi:hypothetical protein
MNRRRAGSAEGMVGMDDSWEMMVLLAGTGVRLALLLHGRLRRTQGEQAAGRTAISALSSLPAGSEVRWVGADGTVWTASTPSDGGQELTR